MKKILLLSITSLLLLLSCKETTKETPPKEVKTATEAAAVKTDFEIIPISHGTAILKWAGKTIYVDPVGGAAAFEGQASPDLILITDIHGDHLNVKTLQGLDTRNAKIIVPQAVADKLPAAFAPQIDVLENGAMKERFGFEVTAIPMYNLREEALKFHTKGRGNGYVIAYKDKRVYFSGDTEDIPEMRSLENIDIAFVCMNLPYTMTEESAASAVLDFKPATVLPYHYRGSKGMSDIFKFKNLVNQGNPDINVLLMDWYAEKEQQ